MIANAYGALVVHVVSIVHNLLTYMYANNLINKIKI